jgi:hypothetical protein
MPEGVDITAAGIKLAGAPIGTDDYCRTFVDNKVKETMALTSKVKGMDPQVGMRLLQKCVGPALTYLQQSVPPTYTREPLAKVHQHMLDTVLQLLQDQDRAEPLPSSPDRMAYVRRKMARPGHQGGFGLTDGKNTAAIAFLASVLGSIHEDPILAEHMEGLRPHVVQAHKYVQQLVGDEVTYQPPRTKDQEQPPPVAIFTKDGNSALDTPFYHDLFTTNPQIKLQKLLTQEMHRVLHAEELKAMTAKPVPKWVHREDLVKETSKGTLARLLTLDLTDKYTRFSPTEFRTTMRMWLGVQPETTVATRRRGEDGTLRQVCTVGHTSAENAALDEHGNHANGNCPATSAASHSRHGTFLNVLVGAANEAGLQATREPATKALLHTDMDEETIRGLFPKRKPSKEQQKATAACTTTLQDGKATAAEKTAAKERLKSFEANAPTAGRRADLWTVDPESGLEHVVDTTVLHTTNKTNIKSSFKHANQIAAQILGNQPPEAKKATATNPAVTKREQDKLDHYAGLMAIMEKQLKEGRRTTQPIFTAAACTTFGEMSTQLLEFTDFVAEAYKRKVHAAGPRPDGKTPAQLKYKFKNKTRQRILVAVAKGTANRIRSAGLTHHACRKHSY